MNANMRGKTVLVTGAEGGAGRAIACAFATAGARVAVQHWGRHSDAQETVRLVNSVGGEGINVEADVSRSDLVDVMIAEVLHKFGAIDILVNSAGNPVHRSVLHSSGTRLDVLETDLDSLYYCCHAVLPLMLRKRSGLILNVTAAPECTDPVHGQTAGAQVYDNVLRFTKRLRREAAPAIQVRALACDTCDLAGTVLALAAGDGEVERRVSAGQA